MQMQSHPSSRVLPSVGAQPPPGWEWLLRIRGEGSTKFVDVYYVAPSGKTLRSTVEVKSIRSMLTKGVDTSEFSFQIFKPLEDNYVRKRPARLTTSDDGNDLGMSRPLEPSKGPADITDLQLGGPGLSAPYFEAPIFNPVGRPAKKQASRALPKQKYSNPAYNQHMQDYIF